MANLHTSSLTGILFVSDWDYADYSIIVERNHFHTNSTGDYSVHWLGTSGGVMVSKLD